MPPEPSRSAGRDGFFTHRQPRDAAISGTLCGMEMTTRTGQGAWRAAGPIGRGKVRVIRPPAARVAARRRTLESIVNVARMLLAVLFGMVLGGFVCAALGY